MTFFKNSSTKPTVEVLQECIPEVLISKEALIKMKLFIEGCTEEIGWLGTAYQDKGLIYISDVLLFEQEVHSTTTEINANVLSDFGQKLLEQPDGVDLWNSIKVWGHSHVNMSTYPSSQDDKQMVTFKDCGHEWFVRIIGNKTGQFRIDVYNYQQGIIYKDVKWNCVLSKEEIELTKLLKQIEEKLSKYDSEIEDRLKEDITKEITDKVNKKVESSYKGYSGKDWYYDYTTKSYKRRDEVEKKEDKKEESKKKEIEKIDTRSKEDIMYDNECLGLYDQHIIEEVAEANSISEVREILDMWGFTGIYDVYDDDDIKEIWVNCCRMAIKEDIFDYSKEVI